MDETRKLELMITQEVGDDEYLDTCEILSPKDLIGAEIIEDLSYAQYCLQ